MAIDINTGLRVSPPDLRKCECGAEFLTDTHNAIRCPDCRKAKNRRCAKRYYHRKKAERKCRK